MLQINNEEVILDEKDNETSAHFAKLINEIQSIMPLRIVWAEGKKYPDKDNPGRFIKPAQVNLTMQAQVKHPITGVTCTIRYFEDKIEDEGKRTRYTVDGGKRNYPFKGDMTVKNPELAVFLMNYCPDKNIVFVKSDPQADADREWQKTAKGNKILSIIDGNDGEDLNTLCNAYYVAIKGKSLAQKKVALYSKIMGNERLQQDFMLHYSTADLTTKIRSDIKVGMDEGLISVKTQPNEKIAYFMNGSVIDSEIMRMKKTDDSFVMLCNKFMGAMELYDTLQGMLKIHLSGDRHFDAGRAENINDGTDIKDDKWYKGKITEMVQDGAIESGSNYKMRKGDSLIALYNDLLATVEDKNKYI